MRRSIDNMGQWRGEATQLRKDGQRKPVEVASIVLRHPDGQIRGYVSVNRDITERKRSEAEIRSLAKFPGENPNPVLRVAIDGRLQYANPASEELLRCWNCADGEMLPGSWPQIVAETLATGTLKEEELLCGGRDFSMVIAPIQGGGYANIYGRDITARKRTEEALRESEERLRLAYEAADLGVWQHDILTGQIFPDQRAKVHSGFEADEVMLADLFERVYPDDLARLEQEIVASLNPAGSGRYHTEYRIIQPNGEIHWLALQAQVHFEGDGETRRPVQIIGTSQDITERKLVEQAILLSKQEWERTFDEVPDLIAILDDQFNIMRLNRPMAERIGRTPQECVGLKCYDVVHGLTYAPEYCPHLLTCQDGLTHAADIHEPHLGGDFLESTTPLFDPEGKMVASVHVARDITVQNGLSKPLRERDELDQRVNFITQELARQMKGSRAPMQS
jgi:PAS domain S-box-containing protein